MKRIYPKFNDEVTLADYQAALRTIARYQLQSAVEIRFDFKMDCERGSQEYKDFGPVRDYQMVYDQARDFLLDCFPEEIEAIMKTEADKMFETGELE